MSIKKVFALMLIATSMISCSNQPKEVTSLNSKVDSVSYAVGLTMSQQLKSNFQEVNEDILLQAIRNGLDSTNLLIDIKDAQTVIRPYFQKKQQEQAKERQEKALKEAESKYADNKKAGEDFIAANKSKKGVVTTASGLQYIVLKEGKGATPKPTDKIRIHYHGTTIKGEVFDSSVDRKNPYESNANQFITGFNEALSLMKEGAKYKVFIPQELAYGAQQRGALIPPLSALVFEIELLKILDK
ncbi:MAG: FKBP-type peptidyl-prolyl cis-trans isomerase [Flavobacteriaceae bacterium]|jgi:FKBP-type peptidyl-prolyl cis-trans isomerase|tara:strand:+ start:7579 stop:8307 length:729 start_codon:yes stop_codon:yes gene_type:complete